MRREVHLVTSIVIALVAISAGYIAVAGMPGETPRSLARQTEAPDEPYIVFLGAAEAQRGALGPKDLQERGVVSVEQWETARRRALDEPLDALLLDDDALDAATSDDLEWLRSMYDDGVVLVGLGVDDDVFAQVLGVGTFRAAAEAIVPLGPTGYRLTSGLVLGHPDDVDSLGDWITRLREGKEPTMPVQHPMATSFRSARGEVNTEEEVELLFTRLESAIRGNYETRSDFQAAQENTEEPTP